jgi:hypothetical protein
VCNSMWSKYKYKTNLRQGMPVEVVNGARLPGSNGITGKPLHQGPGMGYGSMIELEGKAMEETTDSRLGKMPVTPQAKEDDGLAKQESRGDSSFSANHVEASGSSRFDQRHDSGSSALYGFYETSRNKERPGPPMGFEERDRQRSDVSQYPPDQHIPADLGRRNILPKPADAMYQRDQYRNGIEGLHVVHNGHAAALEKREGTTFDGVLPPRKLWRWISGIMFATLIAIIIALAVLAAKRKASSDPSPPVPTATVTSTPEPPAAVVNNYQQGTVQSETERIGATDVVMGTFFGPTVDKPETRVVFDGGDGRLCVKTKQGAAFLPLIKCMEGSNAKDSTPIVVVDWLGGPTIVYVTKDNRLAGYNHVPTNDTWVVSPLGRTNVPVHPQSQLSSVTWLNGTSLWIYYQRADGQLCEWGLDDYRDVNFRDGSAGPLGAALAGSFFGVTRYVLGVDEYEEACYQATNAALHCRRYANSIWGSEVFTIAGTETGLALPASFDYTTVIDPKTKTSVVAVAYIKQNGYVTVQTRATTNGTDLGAFETGVQVTQGDGSNTAGLVVTGESGFVNVYLKKGAPAGGKIFQYSSNSSMTNWTTGNEFGA